MATPKPSNDKEYFLAETFQAAAVAFVSPFGSYWASVIGIEIVERISKALFGTTPE